MIFQCYIYTFINRDIMFSFNWFFQITFRYVIRHYNEYDVMHKNISMVYTLYIFLGVINVESHEHQCRRHRFWFDCKK